MARLGEWGTSPLASREVLALLLGPAADGEKALALADRVLETLAGLGGLRRAGVHDLAAIPGVGPAGAARLVAGVELGRRLARWRRTPPVGVRRPQDVADLVMEEMRGLDREQFRVVLLDAKNRVLGTEIVSIGTLNASLVHPREALKPAIRRSAAAIILVHNHPTGVPDPSPEDLEVTERFVRSGEIVGIDVLDHVIIGDGRFRSLREAGLM